MDVRITDNRRVKDDTVGPAAKISTSTLKPKEKASPPAVKRPKKGAKSDAQKAFAAGVAVVSESGVTAVEEELLTGGVDPAVSEGAPSGVPVRTEETSSGVPGGHKVAPPVNSSYAAILYCARCGRCAEDPHEDGMPGCDHEALYTLNWEECVRTHYARGMDYEEIADRMGAAAEDVLAYLDEDAPNVAAIEKLRRAENARLEAEARAPGREALERLPSIAMGGAELSALGTVADRDVKPENVINDDDDDDDDDDDAPPVFTIGDVVTPTHTIKVATQDIEHRARGTAEIPSGQRLGVIGFSSPSLVHVQLELPSRFAHVDAGMLRHFDDDDAAMRAQDDAFREETTPEHEKPFNDERPRGGRGYAEFPLCAREGCPAPVANWCLDRYVPIDTELCDYHHDEENPAPIPPHLQHVGSPRHIVLGEAVRDAARELRIAADAGEAEGLFDEEEAEETRVCAAHLETAFAAIIEPEAPAETVGYVVPAEPQLPSREPDPLERWRVAADAHAELAPFEYEAIGRLWVGALAANMPIDAYAARLAATHRQVRKLLGDADG